MIILAIAIAAIAIWKIDYINAVYFRDQLTATGWIINGAIITLFTLGVLKMIMILPPAWNWLLTLPVLIPL